MSFLQKLFGKKSSPAPAVTARPDRRLPEMPAPSSDLAAHAHPAWMWELSSGEGATDSTRIGGRPMMGEDEAWPVCGDCKKPLTFMMQCNLDALPDGMADHDSGMLRFFYCLHDDCIGMGGWDAFDPQHHLSILQGYGHCTPVPETTITIPAEHLTDTTKIQDVPHWPDRPALTLSDGDDDVYAMPGHKFAGWPHWIQGAERPNCPDCDAVMEPFIQLDEDWTRAFNFGGGIGHISQCPNHPDSLAFGWAC